MEQTRDSAVIGALKMAFEAAASDRSMIRLFDRLLSYADDTDPKSTEPMRLLVQAIQDEEAQIEVPA